MIILDAVSYVGESLRHGLAQEEGQNYQPVSCFVKWRGTANWQANDDSAGLEHRPSCLRAACSCAHYDLHCFQATYFGEY